MHLKSRSLLDRDLQDLETRLTQLGSQVETAIEDAMSALTDRDVVRAQQVVAALMNISIRNATR